MSNLSLKGKTIVFTGTKKPKKVFEKVAGLGGNPVYLPLIQTKERIDKQDEDFIKKAQQFDWLIFTSQNAVKYFCEKMHRHGFSSKDFSCKVAAVGEKTQKLLEENGFSVHFMPSVFSADVFIKEFPDEYKSQSCLFLRGNLAKETLKEGIPNLVEWTVYETVENLVSIDPLTRLIEKENDVIVIFASPSAVDVFALHIAPKAGWEKVKLASIGHITEAQIQKYGQKVTYQPQIYTLEAIIDEIIK